MIFLGDCAKRFWMLKTMKQLMKNSNFFNGFIFWQKYEKGDNLNLYYDLFITPIS